jgi:hypothetical protein
MMINSFFAFTRPSRKLCQNSILSLFGQDVAHPLCRSINLKISGQKSDSGAGAVIRGDYGTTEAGDRTSLQELRYSR